MAGNTNDLKQLVIREAVRAGVWGIVFLVVFGVLLLAVKQEIKEGIDYTVQRSTYEMVKYATDPYLFGKAKQLVKEGIEYSLEKVGNKFTEVMVHTYKSLPSESMENQPPANKPTSQ